MALFSATILNIGLEELIALEKAEKIKYTDLLFSCVNEAKEEFKITPTILAWVTWVVSDSSYKRKFRSLG